MHLEVRVELAQDEGAPVLRGETFGAYEDLIQFKIKELQTRLN